MNLVIGASGLVGWHLYQELTKRNEPTSGTYNQLCLDGMQKLDIRSLREVKEIIGGIKPSIIFLPAAIANVDLCELKPNFTSLTNITGAKYLIECAKQYNAFLIYFSSDYIFKGEAGPYQESDTPEPICEYGRQKLIVENMVTHNLEEFLIIRTTIVYGWEHQKKNFVYQLVHKLRSGQPISVPYDQIGTPTFVNDLARAVVDLALSKQKGVLHIAGSSRLNRYEFALSIARIFNLNDTLIKPVSTSELNTTVKRPLSVGLRSTKASNILGRSFVDHITGLTNLVEIGI